jgi:hypothetical protein
MAIELDKHNLRSYDQRKRKHKQVITIITLISVFVCLGILVLFIDLLIHKNYTSYQVIHSTKRSDSNSAEYTGYKSGVIRYSNDGAMAMDGAGNLLWNGTYEMKDPIVDVCGKYAAVSDRGYKMVEIFDGEGKMTTVTVTHPIVKTKIAEQGVIAVLMSEDNLDYISFYSADGEALVDIRTQNSKDGYPVDFALSKDGRKMVTSYITMSDGVVNSKLSFYNFGEVGQNYVSRVVAGLNLGQTIIPNVEFVNNDTVCAFGDNKFTIYSMEETPELVYQEDLKAEVQSVLHSEKYSGLVLKNEDTKDKYRVVIYDLKGKKILDKNMNYDYSTIYLSGDELIMYTNLEWIIWKIGGKEKLHYTFDSDISYILPVNHNDKYIVIDGKDINEVKLKE